MAEMASSGDMEDDAREDPAAPDPAAEERRATYFAEQALSEQTREHLRRTGFVVVASRSVPERRYVLPKDGGFTWLYQGGALVALLCGQAVGDLSPTEALIALKLWIEADEEEFLQKVNTFSLDSASSPILRVLAALAPPPEVLA